MNTQRLQAYVIERLKESSTWRGLVLIVTVAGAQISPELQNAIVLLGLGMAGLISAALPDKGA